MKSVVLSMLAMLILSVALQGEESKGRKPATRESGSADDRAKIELITRIETDRLQAGVRKDVAAISLATAEDYMQIDSDGQVLNKAATMERIKSSHAQLQSNPVDDMVVRVYGNTAVVSGRATPKGTINGKETRGSIRYTRVYVNREGRWQVVLFQQTPVAQDK